MFSRFVRSLTILALTLACFAAEQQQMGTTSTHSVSISPSSITFQKQYLGKVYAAQTVNITNTGTASLTLSSFALTGPFCWSSGLAPQNFSTNYTTTVTVAYCPTVAGTQSGTLTLTFKELPNPYTIPLMGTATTTTAHASFSSTNVSFNNVPVGSGASQSITITNTGKASFTISSIFITPPVFATANTFPVTIAAGGSKTLNLSYSPVLPGTQYGDINFTYNILPSQSVALMGTAVPAGHLTLANVSPLPAIASQGFIYNYALQAAAGTPPYSWNFVTGSLPSGLTLNSQGVINGTLASTAPPGNYTATIQVTDSVGSSAMGNITLTVATPPGGQCQNISSNITGTSTPEIPMDSLGAGTYLGQAGGLWGGGVNAIPQGHLNSGINIANSIQPLDASGNPDPTGKYVLVGFGTSTAKYEFDRFLAYMTQETTLNPHLVIVEGAMGSETLDNLAKNGSPWWNNLYNYALPYAGVTPQQVVAVWVEPEDTFAPGTFPADANQLYSELLNYLPNLYTRFPNLKLAYLGSRAYGGYQSNTRPVGEPYAYDQGYALQDAIVDQLNGDPALNFDPSAGPVVAPWLGWSNYQWGNGLTPHNNMVWACADFASDGYHVWAQGKDKAAAELIQFFKTDPTTTPWFLAH